MSGALAPLWSQPARNRILAALGRHGGPLSVREVARLARAAPSTALRVTNALVEAGVLEERKVTGRAKDGVPYAPRMLLVLKKGQQEKLRGEFGSFRSGTEVLEYLAALDGPVWVVEGTFLRERGITRRLGTFVIMPKSWASRFNVPVPVALFEEARPLERAKEELSWNDLFIALLKIDRLAARQYLASRPPTTYTGWRTLIRRIRAEGVADAAAAVGVSFDLRRSDPDGVRGSLLRRRRYRPYR